jgi:hypothetical protein
MVRIMWGDDQVPIYLRTWHVLKGLTLMFNGKNQRQ